MVCMLREEEEERAGGGEDAKRTRGDRDRKIDGERGRDATG